MNDKIIALRMERQYFTNKANEDEYIKLYRDTQPGQNVYWNGFIYKAHEHILKEAIKKMTEGLDYGHVPLQYLLIDGKFHGAAVGHFRNGPYDLNDVVCDLPDANSRKDEILEALQIVNYGKMPLRFMGKEL